MKAKIEVEVRDEKEAEFIKGGLAHAETRVLVTVMGALSRIPNHAGRQAAIEIVAKRFNLSL